MEQNYDEAVRWYRNAAEHDSADAEYGLGRCYCLGHGVKRDSIKGENLFMEAAKHGHKEAQEYFKSRYYFVD